MAHRDAPRSPPREPTVAGMRATIIDKAALLDVEIGQRILVLVHHRYDKKAGVIYERKDGPPSIDINRLNEATVREIYNMILSHEQALRRAEEEDEYLN